MRWQQHRLRHGFPARGMFHQRDVIAGRQPLGAFDPIAEPAGPAQHREDDPRPDPRQLERPRSPGLGLHPGLYPGRLSLLHGVGSWPEACSSEAGIGQD